MANAIILPNELILDNGSHLSPTEYIQLLVDT
jgi:hypothetical protein